MTEKYTLLLIKIEKECINKSHILYGKQKETNSKWISRFISKEH